MRETLERLSKTQAPVCVTLILRTHKTHPENQKDSIQLKNLIAEASQRLQKEYGNEVAKRYTEKLNKIAESVDHDRNDLGLMVFVNDDIAEFLRVPVRPKDRVILDDTFATRTIVRALIRDTDYYLLALSKGRARLIRASSDNTAEEITSDGFPFLDNDLVASTKQEASNSSRLTNLTQEFFNRIDKAVNKVRQQQPLPVVVYSEENNYHSYLKVADYPNTILGHILLKNQDEKPSNLAKEVWPTIKNLAIAKNRARITELEQALSSGNYLSDINEIWTAVQEGRGRTIFVEEGYYQAVRNDNGTLSPIESKDISSKDDINDIVDDMIEYNLKYGGDVVFLDKGSLEKFNKLALVTRY